MVKSGLFLFFMVVMTLTLTVTSLQDPALLPPAKPYEFSSKSDYIQYVKALNNYYAMVGRPRFGRAVNDFEN
ncbi:hypothetical protein ACF0H5_023337 [Mactra antiquata]